MLKKRIIPSLLIKNKKLVKGKEFKNYVNVGDPISAIKVYSHQYADELIFIRIDKNDPIEDLLKNLNIASENCFSPITAGGGITKLKEIELLCKNGADKVIINSYLHENKSFLNQSSKMFGSSTIIAGIDIIKIKQDYFISTNNNKKLLKEKKLSEWIKFLEDNGAGEILINCIHKDGAMNGYDLELAKFICKKTVVPIIFTGGAGNFDHLYQLFANTNVSAAGCSSIFHFGDNNPIRANTYLRNKKINLKKVK